VDSTFFQKDQFNSMTDSHRVRLDLTSSGFRLKGNATFVPNRSRRFYRDSKVECDESVDLDADFFGAHRDLNDFLHFKRVTFSADLAARRR
jgi:hypothetical protein